MNTTGSPAPMSEERSKLDRLFEITQERQKSQGLSFRLLRSSTGVFLGAIAVVAAEGVPQYAHGTVPHLLIYACLAIGVFFGLYVLFPRYYYLPNLEYTLDFFSKNNYEAAVKEYVKQSMEAWQANTKLLSNRLIVLYLGVVLLILAVAIRIALQYYYRA